MILPISQPETELDRQTEQQIAAALLRRHVAALRQVRIISRGGAIVLSGEVRSFHHKQLLQHTVRLVAGDRRVIDEVRVLPPARLGDPIRLRLAATAGVLLLALLATTGCSQSDPNQVAVHPVTGQVLFEGRAAAGATVILHPQQPGDFPAPRARTDAAGNFSLTTYSASDGAPQGDYTITVELRQLVKQDEDFVPGPHVIPPKYQDPKQSRLTAKVAEGQNQLPITLSR